MDFDSILIEIGEIGPYQLLLTVLLCFPITFALPFTFMGQLFQTLTPDHWCHIPEMENTSLSVEEKKALSIPTEVKDGVTGYSQCLYYDRNYTNVDTGINFSDVSEVRPCQFGWEYDFVNFRNTATSEFDWVCDNSLKGYVSLAIFFAGSAVGCLIFGYISDRYGRLPTALLVNMLAFLANVASAFTQGFASFSVIRFIAGSTFDMSHLAFFILVLEYVGPTYRNRVANFTFGTFFTFGSVLLPWVAMWTPDWRYFSIVAAIPFILIMPFFRVIPESARWLISQNRIDDAIHILKKISKTNKKEMKEAFWITAKEDLIKASHKEQEHKNYSVFDLFRTPGLRTRTIITSLTWFLIMLSYDALVRNTENLGWNVYISSTVGNATELPAAIIPILLLDKIGRRLCSLLCFSLGAILCFSVLGIPNDQTAIFVTMAVLARLFATTMMNIFLVYKTELFPTVLRGQAMALAHLIGFLGSMASPFIVFLGHTMKALPLIVIGGVMLLGAILTTFLPETLFETLPDSYQEGEDFGKHQHYLHYPRPKPTIESIKLSKRNTTSNTRNQPVYITRL